MESSMTVRKGIECRQQEGADIQAYLVDPFFSKKIKNQSRGPSDGGMDD
jgi:hypothetical protein